MEADTALTLLLAIPMVASPVIYLIGRISYMQTHGRYIAGRWFTLLVLAATWVPLVIVGKAVLEDGAVDLVMGRILLQMDGVGLFLAATVLLIATLVTIFSFKYIDGEEDEEKYYALLPVMTASMMGLGCTRDLFNLWIWFEAMAISSYLLVAFYHNQTQIPGSRGEVPGAVIDWFAARLAGHFDGVCPDGYAQPRRNSPAAGRFRDGQPGGRRALRHRVWSEDSPGANAYLAS